MKFDFKSFLKSMTPELVVRLIKSIALKYGLGLTGIQGFILGILIRIGIRKADNAIEEISDKIEDKKNQEKYKEIISNENATVEDKIKAETDLLNGGSH